MIKEIEDFKDIIIGEKLTLIPREGLDNIQYCIEEVLKNNIQGDFVETGIWKGGASIFAKFVINHYKSDKKVYLADSFCGLPAPNSKDYPADAGDIHHTLDYLKVGKDIVIDNFKKFNLFDSNVILIEGWFKDTMPNFPCESIAVLRFDGDMYESTVNVLDNLYSRINSGGFCIIDDICIPNCKRAVEDFMTKNKIDKNMTRITHCIHYWRVK